MTVGLIVGQDAAVAAWTFQNYNLTPMHVNSAVGLAKDGQLVGCFFFQHYNRNNIELGYYGVNTMTAGVVKTICRIALDQYNVQRMTLHTRRTNKSIVRFYRAMGAKYEATLLRYYGPTDAWEHTAVQYVLFREDLEMLLKRGKTIQ